jgi:hypothetical protein
VSIRGALVVLPALQACWRACVIRAVRSVSLIFRKVRVEQQSYATYIAELENKRDDLIAASADAGQLVAASEVKGLRFCVLTFSPVLEARA